MNRVPGAVAAIASSLWGIALSIVAIRIYVSRLGVEAYGVIGFFVSLQAVLQVLDLGLAPSVNRELARNRMLDRAHHSRVLLVTLSRVYWVMAVTIALILVAAAPLLGHDWLDARHLSADVVARALAIMGLVIAARWPVALYQNALVGLGRLGTASLVTAVANTLAAVASVATLTFVTPTLPAFFTAQALVAVAYAFVMRAAAWRALGREHGLRFDGTVLRTLWRFSAGMGGVALTGLALTQFDKAVLSKLLPLAQFGEYMLAVTATSSLMALVSPVFNVIYPQLSALVAEHRDAAVRRLYQHGTQFFAGLYLPIAFALGLYAHDLIWLWTGNVQTADHVGPILSLLSIGTAINGVMYFPYALQLAHGVSRLPLMINTVLLMLIGPLVFVLARHYGAVGGAMAWPILQGIYLVVGSIATHRRFAVGKASDWLLRSVGLPALVAIGFEAAAMPVLSMIPAGSVIKVVAVAASVIVAQSACLVFLPDIRSFIVANCGAVLSRLRT